MNRTTRFDWECDCGARGNAGTYDESKAEATQHLVKAHPRTYKYGVCYGEERQVIYRGNENYI